ncbi:transcription antiterminator BglG [Superficieibacter electus]|uniref:Transcription antiterminator BglG n=1 Tax=Superficieibacter electus TaxID=2022662 RepID=A0A2P5GL47_9ENTR|nr:PRD domain-containing protein [Superficieibacter electus]POP42670.1 transcription antiterminator BglG [Superficieibacter electus]POP45746.1 transcription antiterminator BglG [Superficieibacter electus]
MAPFPYQRLAYLFNAIQAETLPQEELAKRFAVSSRTIRTDITLLNEILLEYGAHIHYERGAGYRLVIGASTDVAALSQAANEVKPLPRTSKARVWRLLVRFLTDPMPVKLDEIADEWFVSRGTLQQDMLEVRAFFEKYPLMLETRPRHGIHVSGAESAIRNCISDIFCQMGGGENKIEVQSAMRAYLGNIDLDDIEKILQNCFDRFDIKLSHDALRVLSINCAVSIKRISTAHEIVEWEVSDIDTVVKQASHEIIQGLSRYLGNAFSAAEVTWLQIQIAARRIIVSSSQVRGEINSLEITDSIFNYIKRVYNYDLRHDTKLHHDLTMHLVAMFTRVKYQVSTANPLLEDIKKYYPFAWDVTLSAMAEIESAIPYTLSVDELGYLAIHIGVGLERNYSAGFVRYPCVLIVSDSGNAVQRMIEAKILRQFPQIIVQRMISLREYELLDAIDEDFIISTVRLAEKNRPAVNVALFPTPYQIEQIGRLVMVDRTRPWLLARFFDEKRFMIVRGPMTQGALFRQGCNLLKAQGYINDDFYPSLLERESITSTMLGEGIAIPHALGLRAKKTAVITILAPNGIAWSNKGEVAYVIFLLAICKEDSEEAMGIYDLFMTFVREKATRRLINSQNFSDFQLIAQDSFGRSI